MRNIFAQMCTPQPWHDSHLPRPPPSVTTAVSKQSICEATNTGEMAVRCDRDGCGVEQGCINLVYVASEHREKEEKMKSQGRSTAPKELFSTVRTF